MGKLVNTPEEAASMRRAHPGALLIALTPCEDQPLAKIRIDIADPGLHSRVEAALRCSLDPVRREPPCLKVWKFSTIRRARSLSGKLRGALAMIRASARNAGRLRRLVAQAESCGAAAVQIVCPPAMTEELERVTFRILEERRGEPGRPPLALATTEEPLEILLRNLEAWP